MSMACICCTPFELERALSISADSRILPALDNANFDILCRFDVDKMALPAVGTRVGLTIVLLVNLGTWVISLAGLAKLTDMCRKEEAGNTFGGFDLVIKQDERIYDCGNTSP